MAEFQLVPIGLISADLARNMRRLPATAAEDAALVESIRLRGVLEPIGLRRVGKSRRYEVVFGFRRLRCAKAAGLKQIPAQVGTWSGIDAEIVGAAENLVRAAVHPVDQWRNVAQLAAGGMALPAIAAELGLGPRIAERMRALGTLPAPILALAERALPPERVQRVLAAASEEQRGIAASRIDPEAAADLTWERIVEACRTSRIPRRLAIFDAAAHPELWVEDLFAQPDDPDAIGTADVERFLALQREALAARVAEQKAAGRRIEIAERVENGLPAYPAGLDLIGTVAGMDTGPGERVYTAVRADGGIAEVLVRARPAKAAKPRPAADDSAPESAPDSLPPIAVRRMLCEAKTTALHEAVNAAAPVADVPTLLGITVLALAAARVRVTAPDGGRVAMVDLAELLIGPGGVPGDWPENVLRRIWADAITRMISCDPSYFATPAAAPVEWIGVKLDAGERLPRLDTPAFLSELPAKALADLAGIAGIDVAASARQAKADGIAPAEALRAALAGNLGAWRPGDAQFGAEAP